MIWHVRETIRDHILYDGLLGMLAQRIVCASQAVAQERFAPFGQWLARKTMVVYNGIVPGQWFRDERKRCAWRGALGVEEGEVLLVLLGSFVPLKGHAFAIKGIAAACRRQTETPFRLLCVGAF